MRALLPAPLDDVDVHAYYAAGWLDRGGLRMNFIASADGAVHVNGLSKGLQTPGDNAIFAALRDLADVVLIGAGTAVGEQYDALAFGARRRAIRREHGLRESLPTAVISRTLRLDPAAAMFTDPLPGAQAIVLTCASADAEQRRLLKQVAEVIDCGDETVDSVLARQALEERGLTRILCEGGPNAFADLARDAVVDELCLTISPMLAGPGAGRIIAGGDWPVPHELKLVGLLEEDGALFCRYTTATEGSD